MKPLLLLVFILVFNTLSAQTAQPSHIEHEYFNPATQTWEYESDTSRIEFRYSEHLDNNGQFKLSYRSIESIPLNRPISEAQFTYSTTGNLTEHVSTQYFYRVHNGVENRNKIIRITRQSLDELGQQVYYYYRAANTDLIDNSVNYNGYEDTIEYDTEGYKSQSFRKSINSNTGELPTDQVLRTTYVYNDNRLLIEETLHSQTTANGNWNYTGKRVYEYDDQGRQTSCSWLRILDSGDHLEYYGQSYRYEDNEMTHSITFIDYTPGSTGRSDLLRQVFDNNNLLIEEFSVTYSNLGDQYHYYNTYQYNDLNQLERKIIHTGRNFYPNGYRNWDIYEYHYDSLGLVDTINRAINYYTLYESSDAVLDSTYREQTIYSRYCEGSIDEIVTNGIDRIIGNDTIVVNTSNRKVYHYDSDPNCGVVNVAAIEEQPLSVFPNPTMGHLTIETPNLEGQIVEVSVISQNLQQVLYQTETYIQSINLNIIFLPKGIYFIQLTTNRQSYVQKIIKM